jgi:hypothetical protein
LHDSNDDDLIVVCDCRFAMDNTTGLVTVANGRLLDFELRHSFQLSVTASDGERRSDTTLTIHLRDMNDNAPEFLRPEYRTFVPENAGNLSTALVVKVSN